MRRNDGFVLIVSGRISGFLGFWCSRYRLENSHRKLFKLPTFLCQAAEMYANAVEAHRKDASPQTAAFLTELMAKPNLDEKLKENCHNDSL